MLTALETKGTINSNHQIVLDEALPQNTPDRVRVIVLFDEANTDVSEAEWRKSVSDNEVFSFLNDDSENIYTPADGRPLKDEE